MERIHFCFPIIEHRENSPIHFKTTVNFILKKYVSLPDSYPNPLMNEFLFGSCLIWVPPSLTGF